MRLSFERDEGARGNTALGLIVLQTDETIEPELRGVMGGHALYHTRIPNDPEVTPETLARMEADLPRVAALLPPVEVIGYGCTSASTVIGSDRVAAAIHQTQPDAAVTNPLDATIAACAHLGIKRLAFVTPYVAEVSAAMQSKLEAADLTIAAFGSFEQIEDAVVARIAERSTLAAIKQVAAQSQADAVFASCTNLRGFGIIEQAEAATDIPVMTSNLALAWHMLRLAGISTTDHGPGRLFAS
jgi:maleate isomerase